MAKEKRKRRYSFWKILLWIALLNLAFAALTLVILFYVKLPYQAYNVKAFNFPRYCWRVLGSIICQTLIYYFALNWYYRLLSCGAGWKRYVVPCLCLLVATFIFYGIYD